MIGDDVPMTREELEETVASTICCHTRMSPAVQWEIDLLMGAIDKHIALVMERVSAVADDLDTRGTRAMDSSFCAAAGLIRLALEATTPTA